MKYILTSNQIKFHRACKRLTEKIFEAKDNAHNAENNHNYLAYEKYLALADLYRYAKSTLVDAYARDKEADMLVLFRYIKCLAISKHNEYFAEAVQIIVDIYKELEKEI